MTLLLPNVNSPSPEHLQGVYLAREDSLPPEVFSRKEHSLHPQTGPAEHKASADVMRELSLRKIGYDAAERCPGKPGKQPELTARSDRYGLHDNKPRQ